MECLISFTRNGEFHIKGEKTCSENHSRIKRMDCCLKLLKRKSYLRASLSFRISFISNLIYYFLAFRCFCASCVEWRFQVKIPIANNSNQRNSLSTDFQTSSLVLCTVYFLINFYFTLFRVFHSPVHL